MFGRLSVPHIIAVTVGVPAGKIPKELVQLKALKEVNLQKNRIIGESY